MISICVDKHSERSQGEQIGRIGGYSVCTVVCHIPTYTVYYRARLGLCAVPPREMNNDGRGDLYALARLLAATVNGPRDRAVRSTQHRVHPTQGVTCGIPEKFSCLIVRLMRSVSRRIVGQNEFTRIPPKLANGPSKESSKESLDLALALSHSPPRSLWFNSLQPVSRSPWSPPVLLMMEI